MDRKQPTVHSERFIVCALTLHITGSKKQSDEERGAALFAVRVNVFVGAFLFPYQSEYPSVITLESLLSRLSADEYPKITIDP